MYRNPTKVVHWDFWMFSALGLSIVSTGVNIYATNSLSQNQSFFDVAKSLLLISISLIVINYALEAISNYRELATDIRLRRTLAQSKDVKSSIVNNDINISIGVIHFYAFVPGIVFSIIVYLIFIAMSSVHIFYAFILALMLLYFPIKKYVDWRGEKIQLIRTQRNRLLDDYDYTSENYCKLIDGYSDVYKNFWKRDVSIGLVFVSLIALSIYCVYYFTSSSENRLATLAVYLLLVSQIRSLVLSLSLFQENKRSVSAVEAHIQKAIDVGVK